MLSALQQSVARLLTYVLMATLAVTGAQLTATTAAGAGVTPRSSALDGTCVNQTPPGGLYVTSATRSSAYRLYCAAFLRLPDTGGLDYWTGELLAHRLDVAGMANAFISSPEFAQRYGDVDDRGFLDLVYRNVLGRPSDDQGYRYWAGQLARPDFDRGDLLVSFSESSEFTVATNTAGRRPRPGIERSFALA